VYHNYITSTGAVPDDRSGSEEERGGSLHLRLLAPIQPGQAPEAGLNSRGGRGCEGGHRLLKFDVCWDAALCAVSAGGFFSVWDGARKTNVWHGARKTNDWSPVLSA
jgi:hypothetical protein